MRPARGKNDGSRMDFDPTLLMLSLVPSGIGFVLVICGRRRHRWPQLVFGLLFMAYPYFTASAGAMVGVGVASGAALYFMRAAGW